MEIINYPRLTSSPVSSDTPVNNVNSDGLPSPNLTEPNRFSPKNESMNSGNSGNAGANNSVNGSGGGSGAIVAMPKASTDSSSSSSMLTAMLRSLTASASPNINFSIGKSNKELNITEYSNKELKAMKKRCRTVMTPSQSRVLRKVLDQTAFPSTEIRENLAKLLGMKPRTVQIWFQNQRQKSRQGRGSSEDLQMVSDGSPNSSCASSGSEDVVGEEMGSICSSPFESSPTSTSIASNASSPGFSALTAAAFALSNSNSPIDQNSTSPQIIDQSHNHNQQQQRYTTFHGAVYKSVPGCLPTILPSTNHYRGNTAATMNAKRMAVAHAQVQGIINSNSNGNFPPPPNQPQNIPQYPRGAGNEAIPLDILASAVSKFRPSGYNYYMKPPTPTMPPQQGHWFNNNPGPPPQVINRNRLAPLRASSPPSDTPEASCPVTMKLPSLKDLAQVASIGMTELNHTNQRSKSFSIDPPESEPAKLPIIRRYSSAEVSNNAAAPNSSTTTRRPW